MRVSGGGVIKRVATVHAIGGVMTTAVGRRLQLSVWYGSQNGRAKTVSGIMEVMTVSMKGNICQRDSYECSRHYDRGGYSGQCHTGYYSCY